jgi:predicted nuclease of predicted toxin-antitoxin system
MEWAREHEAIVFTHDLDFGIILAHTRLGSPSVLQVRTQDVSPEELGPTIVSVLNANQFLVERGALITVDHAKARVRILPIARGE